MKNKISNIFLHNLKSCFFLNLTSSSKFIKYTQKNTFSSSSDVEYDVAVIGGGPGGYVAAIKAAQLGLKTVCIEKRGTLGGTCLNVGCIPSKSLLNISHKYFEAVHDFEKMGIMTENTKIDLSKMMSQKDKSVKTLTQGIEYLFKKNKVTYIKGNGKLLSSKKILIEPLLLDSSKNIKKYEIITKNIIIATGSKSIEMKNIPFDKCTYISSTEALSLSKIPNKLIVIGGGVIGCEIASLWSRLGVNVTVIEYTNRICTPMDVELSNSLQKLLTKQGMKFELSTKVISSTKTENGAIVHVEAAEGGKPRDFEADLVLVAIGRAPNTEGLGLEEMNIQTDDKGKIVVDDSFSVPNYPSIKAIGDVIRGPMLAHKAEEEGISVAEIIKNKICPNLDYNAIPSVVYTHPELAGVGYTEDELKAKGIEYNKGIFSFAANSRAKTNDDSDGMVKILSEKSSNKLLGGWILGVNGGELLGELTLTLAYEGSCEDISKVCHPHPTLSEAVKEACMDTFERPIHM